MTLAGKVAVVTGAGSGIGRAAAMRLASDGAAVAIADLNAESLAETESTVRSEQANVLTEVMDVAIRSDVERLIASTVERFGRLDAMVSNAGIPCTRPFLETSEEELDRVLAVNLKGVFFCGQAAARQMRDAGLGGQIVNIASTYSEVCAADNSAYCASKGGVRMLTKAMALESARSESGSTQSPLGGSERA